MSSNALLAGIPISKSGLNYLVPTTWWNQFYSLNRNTDPASFQVLPLNIHDYADCFLLTFHKELVEQLQQKSNYLKFHIIKISLQPQRRFSWTPVNPAIWRKISRKCKDNHGILTIVEEGKKYDLLDTTQIRIIFCSKSRSDAFVGFIPKKANLVLTVRQIGFQMGFIEVVRSKIAFLDKNPELGFSFHELEKYSLENAGCMTFMAFNMERNDDQIVQNVVYFERLANQSNQAVVGDLNTMEDDTSNHRNQPINNRTMSTGADTPFSLVLSEGFDLDREYRVKELFGSKQPEQIEELRQLAMEKIEREENFIQLPLEGQGESRLHLEKLADQLIEGFLKKKTGIHKQKEKEMEFSGQ